MAALFTPLNISRSLRPMRRAVPIPQIAVRGLSKIQECTAGTERMAVHDAHLARWGRCYV